MTNYYVDQAIAHHKIRELHKDAARSRLARLARLYRREQKKGTHTGMDV